MANVKVAYPGLYSEFDSEAVLNQYESGLLGEISKRKFFLFVGTIETRKNFFHKLLPWTLIKIVY